MHGLVMMSAKDLRWIADSTVTPEQRAFLDRVAADGGIAIVADDVATVARVLG